MASTAAEVRSAARVGSKIKIEPPPGATKKWVAFMFLLPALFFLGALVVYPTLDTIGQSFRDASGSFVGIDNYKELADTPRIVTAIKNTFIWVATAPAIITGLGLVFAILTERVRYQTAIKILVFMPMAISFLATGVIWRVMYDPDPAKGFVNATVGVAADAVNGPGLYPDAVVPPGAPLQESAGGVATRDSFTTGETALIGLTAIAEDDVPTTAVQAAGEAATDGFAVVVWRDFKPGGGTVGKIEEGELGLPGAEVQVLGPGGAAVATATTGPNGSVTFDASELGEGPFTVRVAESTFATGFEGVNWLGPDIVTPAIIAAFCWMWAGFAVVVIGAGLAALPRDVLEAARVDGANEWQTFRYVTMPLLAPVLGVVFVTMVINVLKIFDIVYVTAPGSSQDEANVIALEMFKTTFSSRDYGVGSAVAVLLFVLVIPVMYLNIRRFRREEN